MMKKFSRCKMMSSCKMTRCWSSAISKHVYCKMTRCCKMEQQVDLKDGVLDADLEEDEDPEAEEEDDDPEVEEDDDPEAEEEDDDPEVEEDDDPEMEEDDPEAEEEELDASIIGGGRAGRSRRWRGGGAGMEELAGAVEEILAGGGAMKYAGGTSLKNWPEEEELAGGGRRNCEGARDLAGGDAGWDSELAPPPAMTGIDCSSQDSELISYMGRKKTSRELRGGAAD